MKKKHHTRRVKPGDPAQDIQDATNSGEVPVVISESIEEKILQAYEKRDRKILEPALEALSKVIRETP